MSMKPSIGWLLGLGWLLSACASPDVDDRFAASERFSIAVIPDTQNYIDYRHQRAEGFVLDGQAMFMQQMRDISGRPDIAFVASVGDVWQHSTLPVDPEHAARGVGAIDNPYFGAALAPDDRTFQVEIPGAIQGYRLLKDAAIPFGVAPGNHDYDAFWSAAGYPPRLGQDGAALDPAELDRAALEMGVIHIGGLDNFRSVFGDQGEFFKNQSWYVDSYRGGANSAQIFAAGGYQFLHITLEMSADDSVLRWAGDVIRDHPHYPTIITTHDYLNSKGERLANPILDLAAVDPEHHNNAEQIWGKLISAWDQVFMVLSGHHHGQAYRVDRNHYGNPVYQLMADYQGRGQAGLDAGADRVTGLGDGWYRLMQFDFSTATPTLQVQTWSSHYRSNAGKLSTYADWYRDYEQPGMNATEFVAADEFEISLAGFRERFSQYAN
ncbi:MAG: hypothetical protein ABJ308_01645 [Halieaceae bacterium]